MTGSTGRFPVFAVMIRFSRVVHLLDFSQNAGHTDGAVKRQTLPEALEYVWQGYPIVPTK